jgi:hypothetical protein
MKKEVIVICAIAMAIVMCVTCLAMFIMGKEIRSLNTRINIQQCTNAQLTKDQLTTQQCTNAQLTKDQLTTLQRICVVTDGVADHQVYDLTPANWRKLLMELPATCTISDFDMNMFQYTRTEDIQYPEEVKDYTANSDNEMFDTCTTTGLDYETVFFGNGIPVLLGYKQNPDYQRSDYVEILMICDKDAAETIEFKIDGARNAKKVYCNEECPIGRELLVFCIVDKLYALNEEMFIYEITTK